MRVQDQTVVIRSDRPVQRPIYSLPLQRPDGELRADVGERLSRGALEIDLEELHERLVNDPSMERQPETLAEMQKHLLVGPELSVLRSVASGDPRLEFHRLLTSDSFSKRQVVLKILTDLARGIEPSKMKLGSARGESYLLSGLLELGPGVMVGPLLAARNQPLAVIFSTRRAAQIAMIPRRGALVRPDRMPHLPLGFGDFSVLGHGNATYEIEEPTIGDGAAKQALDAALAAVDLSVLHLTDPARWTDPDGVFDAETRWVAWSNVLAGMAAIGAVAEHWSDGDEGLWAAFRALGILQGLWLGARSQQALGFHELLTPERLRGAVLPELPVGAIEKWGRVVVSSYERMLNSAFPAPSLEDSARQLVEVRNLMHGVGASPTKVRDFTDRLEVLRQLDSDGQVSLHTVMDLATLWWTATIASPTTHLRLGRAPWEQSPGSMT